MEDLGEALYSLISGGILLGCWWWLFRNFDQISLFKGFDSSSIERYIIIIITGYWLFLPINYAIFNLTLPLRENINSLEDVAEFLVGIAITAFLGWLFTHWRYQQK